MIKTMSDSIFHIFSNELFLDLTVYQYGYEKCDPLHSYGPFVRNHYLFHYIISGKGMLSVTEKDDSAVYHMEAHSGFLIEPGRINLYSADQKFPWEYVWVEFDGLRAKELMEEAGLSNDHPVFHPISDTAADKLRDEMLRLTVALTGGILMGLGARWADGCTSGHGISGTLQLSLASWIAVICFFAAGIIAAGLIYGFSFL